VLYACAARFDITENLENFLDFDGTALLGLSHIHSEQVTYHQYVRSIQTQTYRWAVFTIPTYLPPPSRSFPSLPYPGACGGLKQPSLLHWRPLCRRTLTIVVTHLGRTIHDVSKLRLLQWNASRVYLVQLNLTSELVFVSFSFRNNFTCRAKAILVECLIKQLHIIDENNKMTTIPFFSFFFPLFLYLFYLSLSLVLIHSHGTMNRSFAVTMEVWASEATIRVRRPERRCLLASRQASPPHLCTWRRALSCCRCSTCSASPPWPAAKGHRCGTQLAELHLVVAASARAPPCRCSSCFASAPMLLRRCSTRSVSPSPRMQGQKGLGPYADEAWASCYFQLHHAPPAYLTGFPRASYVKCFRSNPFVAERAEKQLMNVAP